MHEEAVLFRIVQVRSLYPIANSAIIRFVQAREAKCFRLKLTTTKSER